MREYAAQLLIRIQATNFSLIGPQLTSPVLLTLYSVLSGGLIVFGEYFAHI